MGAGEGAPVAQLETPHRLLDGTFLRFLPWPIREPRRAWLTLTIGPILTIGGALLLAFLVKTFLPHLKSPVFPESVWWVKILNIVVVSPVVETLIMALFLRIFLLRLDTASAIVASAITWGLLHSLMFSGWGLVVWWPFIIFSTVYLAWRQKGFWVGIVMAASVHLMNNLIGLGLAEFAGK